MWNLEKAQDFNLFSTIYKYTDYVLQSEFRNFWKYELQETSKLVELNQ